MRSPSQQLTDNDLAVGSDRITKREGTKRKRQIVGHKIRGAKDADKNNEGDVREAREDFDSERLRRREGRQLSLVRASARFIPLRSASSLASLWLANAVAELLTSTIGTRELAGSALVATPRTADQTAQAAPRNLDPFHESGKGSRELLSAPYLLFISGSSRWRVRSGTGCHCFRGKGRQMP